jgi:hypothetical protein
MIVKPGIRTTEFWMTLVAVVAGAVAASGLLPEGSQASQIVGLIVMVMGSLGYGVGRGLAKKNCK